MRHLFRILFGSVLLLVLLAGCSPFSNEQLDQAKSLGGQIERLEERLTTRQAAFEAKRTAGGEEWQFFARYAESENWSGRFTEAGTEVQHLKTIKAEIDTIVAAKKESDVPVLTAQLERFKSAADRAKAAIDYVDGRMKLLQGGYDNAEAWSTSTEAHLVAINQLVKRGEAAALAAEAKFPDRQADIRQRWSLLLERQAAALAAVEVVRPEFAKHQARSNADYAAFADAVKIVEAERGQLDKLIPKFEEQLAELSKEYVTVLTDMDVRYRVQIGRSSWNNSVEGGGRDYIFPNMVEVPEATFAFLSALEPGEWKGYSDNLAGLKWRSMRRDWVLEPHIPDQHWRHLLGGVPPQTAWPKKSHDTASFWIEDLEVVYYHRYDYVQDGVVTDSGWVELNEEFDTVKEAEEYFTLYAAALGMTIESKPYGMFEDEAIEEPTPPGMDLVGNSQYGEWRQDGGGTTFWHFYGQYRFWGDLIGGPGYYTQADYRGWETHRAENAKREHKDRTWGFYGANRSQPTFGTAGSRVQNSSRFAQTNFAQSGGFNRASQTIRSAGSAARTRGPRAGK